MGPKALSTNGQCPMRGRQPEIAGENSVWFGGGSWRRENQTAVARGFNFLWK